MVGVEFVGDKPGVANAVSQAALKHDLMVTTAVCRVVLQLLALSLPAPA